MTLATMPAWYRRRLLRVALRQARALRAKAEAEAEVVGKVSYSSDDLRAAKGKGKNG